MAKIGCRYLAFKPHEEEHGKILSPLASANLTYESATGSLDGDDITQIDVSLLTGATLATELTEMPIEDEAMCYGHALDENGEMVINTDDVAPDGELAFLQTLMRRDKNIYFRGLYFTNAKAQRTNDNANTRQRSAINFGSEPLQFRMVPDEDGDLQEKKEFSGNSAESEALAWLKAKLNIED